MSSIQPTHLTTTTKWNVAVQSQHSGSVFIKWPPSVTEDVHGFLSSPCQNKIQATFLSARSESVTHVLQLYNSGSKMCRCPEQQGNKEEINEK